MDDELEVTAKLKLDTTEAEQQLQSLTDKATKKTAQATKVTSTVDKGVKLPEGAQKSLKEMFSGDKGLENVGKVAQGAMSGVNGLSGALTGILPKLGVVTAIVSLLVKLFQGTDTMAKVLVEFNKLWKDLQQLMSPIISLLGDIILVIIQLVKDLLPLLQPVIDVIALALEQVLEVLKVLEPIIRLVGKAFEFVYSIIKGLVKLLTFGLVDLGETTGSTSGTKKGDWKSSLDVWETTGDTTEQQQVDEGKKTNTFLSKISDFLNKIVDSISNVFTKIKDFLSPVFDAFKVVFDGIKSAINWLSENIIKPIYNVIVSIYNNLVKPVIDFFTELIDWTRNFFSKLWDGIKGVFTKTATSTWEGVKDFGSNLFSGWFADKSKGFGGGIFSKQGRWSNGYQVGDVLGTIGDIGAGIVGKGWLWEDGGTLPTYQNSGTLDLGAQVWGMSEQGNPEFLFNAGGHKSVINAGILEDAMYSAFMKAYSQQSTKLEVSTKSTGSDAMRALANALLPYLKFNLGR